MYRFRSRDSVLTDENGHLSVSCAAFTLFQPGHKRVPCGGHRGLTVSARLGFGDDHGFEEFDVEVG